MAVKSAICSCGNRSRKGQRTCKLCHAIKMKSYRQAQVEGTVFGWSNLKNISSYRNGVSRELLIQSVQDKNQVKVKVILCKNPKNR